MRTRELHGSGYYHVGSPVDTGYAEQMRAMYGREDVDPPREDPPTLASQSAGWQSRPGQSVPAFPGSRILLTRKIDSPTNEYSSLVRLRSRS